MKCIALREVKCLSAGNKLKVDVLIVTPNLKTG